MRSGPLTELPVRLGGSTIAAACGIDPFCSPIRLWLELTRGTQRVESEAMRIGTRLEPVIFDELNVRGYPCERTPLIELHDHKRPWLIGHPDGVGLHDLRDSVIEAKATGRASDAPHPWHEAQVQTYMHLWNAPRAVIAQLAGLSLSVWEVERRPHLIDVLLRLAEDFMGYVWTGTQPPPQGHRDDRDALLLAWPDAVPGKLVRESREVRDARRELRSLMEREKVQKARMEALRATITNHMEDADTLVSSHDEVVATWKSVTSRRFDTTTFKQARPDDYAAYAPETKTRRLSLT